MFRNVTYYTGRLVCCSQNSDKINIMLATQNKTEIIKNGNRQEAKAQSHIGYNTWSIAPENFPQALITIPINEKPAVFVLVEDDGKTTNISVKLA